LNDVPEMNPDQNNMYNNGNGMNPYDNNNNYYNGQEPSRQNSTHSNDQDDPYYGQQQQQQQLHPQDMDPNSHYYGPPPTNNIMNNNGYNDNAPPPPNHNNGYPSYPNMNEYAEILGSTNQLTMDQRQFIVDFLNGKKGNLINDIKINIYIYI